VTDASLKVAACARAESAAAYLDGELDARAAEGFEEHARACSSCSAALSEQRRLLCMLDTAFRPGASAREMELPRDFARVVTARARTDMGGVRSRSERAFSVKLSLALAAVCAVLIGASTGDSVLAPVAALARAALGAGGMLLRALIDAGEGAAVIFRALGSRLVAGPGALSALYCLLFAGALLLLLRLIRSYHRAH
jgi:hypothetical protein